MGTSIMCIRTRERDAAAGMKNNSDVIGLNAARAVTLIRVVLPRNLLPYLRRRSTSWQLVVRANRKGVGSGREGEGEGDEER